MELAETNHCWRLLLCLLLASDGVHGMALSSKPRTSTRVVNAASVTLSSVSATGLAVAYSADDTIDRFHRSKTPNTAQKELRTRWGTVTASNGENLYEGDDDDELVEFEVDFFQELQRSTGSEILDDQLQSQIDQATNNQNPNRFLDAHVADASYIEKVAMSSITEQLPQPAVNALRKKNNKSQSNPVTNKKFGLQFSSVQQVSPDEEIQLAKMIQRGVRLHKIKADYEETNRQKLSRNDWATLAGLDSATELRREVATYRRAKQLLVSANIGLVHAVVKKQYKQAVQRSGVGYEELVQEGSLGLLRAAELFDSSRGLRFSTYATIWIKGTLGNSHVTETIKLPTREKTKWNKIVKTNEELTKEHGSVDKEPTIEQIANRMGLNVEDVAVVQRRVKQAKRVLSLDYEYKQHSRSGDDYGGRGGLENDKNFQSDADLAERTQMQADVIATLANNLTPREARLMRLRYGLTDGQTRSLKECAEAMGLSETRVQQLSKECLKKLREAADAESLEEYLLTIA
jgi:RNA polymerase sigma factor (sigma-70 family)